MCPHGCYPCQGDDKWIAIAVSSDDEWQALCSAMGNPDWSKDERFSNQYVRLKNQDELDTLIAGWTKAHSAYELTEQLQRVGVAAAPSIHHWRAS